MTTRRSIKEKLVSLLKGKTLAVDNVHASRSIPTSIENLPVVLIYLKNEDVELFDESPRRYKRVASIVIECISSGDTDDHADNNTEKLLSEVESILALDETLDCLVSDSWLGNVNFQSEPDGQSPVAAAIATFNVEYFFEPVSKKALPDYLRNNVDWQVGHHGESPDDVIDATDQYEIPQE